MSLTAEAAGKHGLGGQAAGAVIPALPLANGAASSKAGSRGALYPSPRSLSVEWGR